LLSGHVLDTHGIACEFVRFCTRTSKLVKRRVVAMLGGWTIA